MSRNNTIYAFCLICLVMFLGGKALVENLSPMFDKIDSNIEAGSTIVMNGEIDSTKLTRLLLEGNYVSDPKDAALISRWYKEKIESGKRLENLGALNTNDFKIPDSIIISQGGEELNSRLVRELDDMGQTESWRKLDRGSLKSTLGEAGDSSALIRVKVVENLERGRFNIFSKKNKPIKDVVVRIVEYRANDSITDEDSYPFTSDTIGYALTDAEGYASFHMPKGRYYGVLPVDSGYQFGQEKGTTKGALEADMSDVTFVRKPHALTPFRIQTYSRLKRDKALISRSPSEFKNALWGDIFIFIGCWLIVFYVIAYNDRRLGRTTDSLIPLSLMTLTGLGMLTLYGQIMPLSDVFYGHKMMDITALRPNNFSGGIVIGCALMALLSCVNYLKLYQKYRKLWITGKSFDSKIFRSLLPGLPFVGIAILLMLMLRVFGSGPEGSDAKVNLMGFQPSEIIKYFIVLALAFFFVEQGEVIKTYGQKMTTLARRRHWLIISGVLVMIAFISLLFLGLLKDMGPGIVILATFILMYSIVRRDVPQLLLGILSYMIIVGAAFIISSQPGIRVLAVAGWLVLWIVYNYRKYKTVYESAIFFNALVSMFLVGGYILRPFLPTMADRLINRTNIAWSGIFDNSISQGDQIAQGLWGTASGGFSGMGVGGGSSYFIPAGHTDLILNSLGEQMGWLGIVIIAVCFFILISRTTVAAQYSGHKFTFYFTLGLGLLMGVQFLFIALGCVGALPLSGVPVPYLSYSGTSMVTALAMYGIVISVSRHRGSPEALKTYVFDDRIQKETPENKEARSLGNNLFAGMVIFFIGVICVAGINAYYQLVVPGQTMIRPSITATSTGRMVLEYNPRIDQVLQMIDRGNIYDRNGLLLATSDSTEMKNVIKENSEDYPEQDNVNHKRLKRYYPFGNYTVFMVGDVNRPDAYANYGEVPMGYLAEERHAEYLKGYKTAQTTKKIPMTNYKYHRFLDPKPDTVTFILRDYSEILPALASSVYKNQWIKDHTDNRESRDLYLTMDAKLQKELEDSMEKEIENNAKLKRFDNLRASVVVIDAKSGDVLASAMYPLPNADSIVNLRTYKYNGKTLDRKGGAPSEWRPGSPITERDLGLTYQTAPGSTAKVMTALAGLKKLGANKMHETGYEIKKYMNIEKPNSEPNIYTTAKNRNNGRKTFMENAIKYSSNNYFIMLLNEENLYPQLLSIYEELGVNLGWTPDRKHRVNTYMLYPSEKTDERVKRIRDKMTNFEKWGLSAYRGYMNRYGNLPENKPWEEGHRTYKMNSIQRYTGIAWGQSDLEASPYNMARLAGAVGNDGVLVAPRFIKEEKSGDDVVLIDKKDIKELQEAMKGEASKYIDTYKSFRDLKGRIGGKTGTPNRQLSYIGRKNDGWYICYVENPETNNIYAISVRLERLNEGEANSGDAVSFVDKVVLKVLSEMNYIKNK